MDNLWIIHGLSMDIHGLSMENSWISMDYPWISGDHFRHQMARHSTKPISTIFRCASLRISRFLGFHLAFFWISVVVVFYVGWHCRAPRISLDAAGVSRDLFGGILWWSDFSRNPKFMTNKLCKCFPWLFSTKLGPIDSYDCFPYFPDLQTTQK